MTTKALILFDLDGTLVDSRLDLAESTNEMLESYGAAPLPVDAVGSMVGDGARMLVYRALVAAGVSRDKDEALRRFREIYDRRLLNHTQPYPGITEVVRTAADHAKLAVLTNKPTEPARRLLEAFGLAHEFSWVLGGDLDFPRKPDPAAAQYLMEQAGVSAERTLFVGDSMVDVETARQAGVRVCVARYGFGHLRGELTLNGDEYIADQPVDVGQVIQKFLGAGR
jgi:phosphoglycolate phosphatase